MSFIETNTIVHLERVPTNARESARITATSDGRVNTYLVVLQYFNVHARTKPDESITSEGWGSNLFGRAPRKMGSDRWQRARLSSSRGCRLKPRQDGKNSTDAIGTRRMRACALVRRLITAASKPGKNGSIAGTALRWEKPIGLP